MLPRALRRVVDANLPLYLETVQANAKVTIECEYEVVSGLSNGVISNDFERLKNPGFKVTVFFKGGYLKNGSF